MNSKPDVSSHGKVITAILLLLSFIIVIVLLGSSTTTRGSGAPMTTMAAPSTCGYCEEGLVGVSPDAVAASVQANIDRLVSVQHLDTSVFGRRSQVLKVVSMQWEQSSSLGLGCLVDFSSIETPPMALVILQGKFKLSSLGPGMHNLSPSEDIVSYLAVVVDLWSSGWVKITGSNDRTVYGAILGGSKNPNISYTALPSCKRSVRTDLHYGQSAGGILVEEQAPEETPTPQLPPMPVETITP